MVAFDQQSSAVPVNHDRCRQNFLDCAMRLVTFERPDLDGVFADQLLLQHDLPQFGGVIGILGVTEWRILGVGH